MFKELFLESENSILGFFNESSITGKISDLIRKPLKSFDSVDKFTIAKGNLYIDGTKNGEKTQVKIEIPKLSPGDRKVVMDGLNVLKSNFKSIKSKL